jgi:hypothetical protein
MKAITYTHHIGKDGKDGGGWVFFPPLSNKKAVAEPRPSVRSQSAGSP